MKIEFRWGDTEFRYERPRLPAGRFRALCLLAAAALYVAFALGILFLSDEFGVLVVFVMTVLAPILFSAIKADF